MFVYVSVHTCELYVSVGMCACMNMCFSVYVLQEYVMTVHICEAMHVCEHNCMHVSIHATVHVCWCASVCECMHA